MFANNIITVNDTNLSHNSSTNLYSITAQTKDNRDILPSVAMIQLQVSIINPCLDNPFTIQGPST